MDMTTIIQAVVAVAGGIIGAFVAGYTIFFPLGKSIGASESISTIRDREATIERQNVSLATVSEEIRAVRDENAVLRAQIGKVPSQPEVDALTDLLNRSEGEVWLEFPSRRAPAHDDFVSRTRCPIVSVVNLKGGVSKTTISANLGAYFDSIGKRVLLVDADFQGSLSDNLLRLSQTDSSTAKIDEWLSSSLEPDVILRTANRAGNRLPNTAFVTAFYELASIETKLMMKWLLSSLRGTEPVDVRYALARIFHSPAALNHFDVVIIDCPPRLSTATVAALCASSHIVVPTNADERSAETVPNFTQMAQRLLAELNPNIRLAGVIPTMTYQGSMNADEQRVIEDVREEATHFGGDLPHIFRNVPWKQGVKKLRLRQVAFLDGPADVKAIYKELGEQVAHKIGL